MHEGNHITAPGLTRAVRVAYYAALREERGIPEERVETRAATAADLYDELCGRHGFRFHRDQLRVAVNEAFAPWDTPLSENDEVVFIPPVAGG